MPSMPVVETLWLDGIVQIERKPIPNSDGDFLLTIEMLNGRKYVIPAKGAIRQALERAVNPVPVFGPSDMPKNGYGA